MKLVDTNQLIKLQACLQGLKASMAYNSFIQIWKNGGY